MESFGIVDYSILLGIHDVGRTQGGEAGHGATREKPSLGGTAAVPLAAVKFRSQLAKFQNHRESQQVQKPSLSASVRLGEAVASEDGQEMYFIGLIDALTTYDARKAAEDLAKRGLAVVSFRSTTEHSVVEPKYYRERQVELFNRSCGKEETSLTPTEIVRRVSSFSDTSNISNVSGSSSRLTGRIEAVASGAVRVAGSTAAALDAEGVRATTAAVSALGTVENAAAAFGDKAGTALEAGVRRVGRQYTAVAGNATKLSKRSTKFLGTVFSWKHADNTSGTDSVASGRREEGPIVDDASAGCAKSSRG